MPPYVNIVGRTMYAWGIIFGVTAMMRSDDSGSLFAFLMLAAIGIGVGNVLGWD